jgi:hypothetical protein
VPERQLDRPAGSGNASVGQSGKVSSSAAVVLGIAFLFSLVAVLGRLVPRWILLPFVAALATAPWFWAPLGSVMIDSPEPHDTATSTATEVRATSRFIP